MFLLKTKYKGRRWYIGLISLLIIFYTGTADGQTTATLGGIIQYDFIGSPAAPYRYKVNVSLFTEGKNAPDSVLVKYSSSCFTTNSVVAIKQPGGVSPYPPFVYEGYHCLDSSFHHKVEIHKYQTVVNLPSPCGDWKFSTAICCRSSNITNINLADTTHLYLEATLNLDSLPNSSPLPVHYFSAGYCINPPTEVFRNHFSVEPDGDSLYYTLSLPRSKGGKTLDYTSPYNKQVPFSSSTPIVLDSTEGSFHFTPTTSEVVVMNILTEEFRKSNNQLPTYLKISESVQEFSFWFSDSCNNEAIDGNFFNTPSETEIFIHCQDSSLILKSKIDINQSSLATDGSDFLIYNESDTLEIKQALWTNPLLIKLILSEPVSQVDTFYLTTHTGSDGNKVINICGFPVNFPDSVAVIVTNCNQSTTAAYYTDIPLKLYPNPAGDFLNLELTTEDEKKLTLILYDLSGRMLYRKEMLYSGDMRLNINHLHQGTYLVAITGAEQSYTGFFIKK